MITENFYHLISHLTASVWNLQDLMFLKNKIMGSMLHSFLLWFQHVPLSYTNYNWSHIELNYFRLGLYSIMFFTARWMITVLSWISEINYTLDSSVGAWSTISLHSIVWNKWKRNEAILFLKNDSVSILVNRKSIFIGHIYSCQSPTIENIIKYTLISRNLMKISQSV